jgi:N-acetylmuramoyl-L-alanine amidase
LIDPGHGGQDSGAPGIGGALEKDIVLSVSRKVAAILRQSGVQVALTRDSDYFVTLPGRVAMVPRTGADVFVSIHANSIRNRPDVNGLEVYYFGPGGERLARSIHRSVIQNVGINDRGVRRARFYVLRKNSVPATLVELGFVTSPSEIRRLTSPAYQNEMAAAIARGILQFIGRQ